MSEQIKLPTSEEHKKLISKLNINAKEIYSDIDNRIKSIIKQVENKEVAEEDYKAYTSSVTYDNEEYMDVSWRNIPIARIYPIKIKRELNKESGETRFDLSMQFMDLRNV
jgi:hypothetical protein